MSRASNFRNQNTQLQVTLKTMESKCPSYQTMSQNYTGEVKTVQAKKSLKTRKVSSVK